MGLVAKFRLMFKPDEDPLGYSHKKMYTKEEFEFLKHIYLVSKRLGILDDNGAIDRHRIRNKIVELSALSSVGRAISMDDFILKAQKNFNYDMGIPGIIQRGNQVLLTDSIFKYSRNRVSRMLSLIDGTLRSQAEELQRS